jgi:hypothetical protein
MSMDRSVTEKEEVFGSDGLRELRAAQARARSLREEAIARLREQIRAFAGELSLTSQELQSLLPRKRKSPSSQGGKNNMGEEEGVQT